MLITFSGIVGSGKSTNAKHAFKLLQQQGYSVFYIRFRFLTWWKIFQPLAAKKKALAREEAKLKRREKQLRCQPTIKLSLIRFLGYLGRMLIFHVFLRMRVRQRIVIVDRFYYDNFSHYKLIGRTERFYLEILKKVLPIPDLALMLIAQPKTIMQRRPLYESDYVRDLFLNYTQVAREFPNLVVIQTDQVGSLANNIAQHVEDAVQLHFRIRMEPKLQ